LFFELLNASNDPMELHNNVKLPGDLMMIN